MERVERWDEERRAKGESSSGRRRFKEAVRRRASREGEGGGVSEVRIEDARVWRSGGGGGGGGSGNGESILSEEFFSVGSGR